MTVPLCRPLLAMNCDSDSSLALSEAGEEEIFSSASSSSEGSYVSAPRGPEQAAAMESAACTMQEVREPEIVPEVHHYPIVSQRHTWCVDEEHLHYQASYQHQIVHGFSSTFIRSYQCFGRSRGRRLNILEVRDSLCAECKGVKQPHTHFCLIDSHVREVFF